jgi:hypothetical protein
MFVGEIFVLREIKIWWMRCISERSKRRTGNFSPYIEKEPVPSPLRKSPPSCFWTRQIIGGVSQIETIPWHMNPWTLFKSSFRMSCSTKGSLRDVNRTLWDMKRISTRSRMGETNGKTLPVESCILITLWSRIHPWIRHESVARLRIPKKLRTYLYSPVHSCLKFSAVLYIHPHHIRAVNVFRNQTYLGTTSLNNSNFILPAGVSPIWMSMKTTGRCGPAEWLDIGDELRSNKQLNLGIQNWCCLALGIKTNIYSHSHHSINP